MVIASRAAGASPPELTDGGFGVGAAAATLVAFGVVAVAAVLLVRHIRHLQAALRRAEEERHVGERFTQALLAHSSDLIAILNRDGTLRYASPSHERVLGYTAGELLGRNAFDLVHPDDRAPLVHAFTQGLQSGAAPQAREFRFLHKDGSWRMVEAAAVMALDDPVIAGVVINSRDITARRRAETEKAALAADLYAAQSEEAAVAAALARIGRVLIAELDQPVLLDRLCRLTVEELGCDMSYTYLLDKERGVYLAVAGVGHSGEEWEALRVVQIPQHQVERYARHLHEVDVVEFDIRALGLSIAGLTPPGEVPRILTMALRRGGELVGVQAARYRDRVQPCSAAQERIGRGIAQLASMALENARLVEELDRASRAKADFVASMSHELRTPLNVIIGYSDLLVDQMFGELQAEQSETVRRIGEKGRELLELVNTTLDMSRLDAGRAPLTVQEVDLVDVLAEIELEAQLVRRNPALDVRWQVAPTLQLWTDPMKLKVIIKNLLINALKFTDQGGVVVNAAVRDGGVEIAVTDTGIGIAPDMVQRIFEPFRQGEHGDVRRGGVGLGLHIVRRLLDALGGTIAVESQPQRGSTFRVWVPSSPSADPPAAS
jgi:PAS domain S-box-containing protein